MKRFSDDTERIYHRDLFKQFADKGQIKTKWIKKPGILQFYHFVISVPINFRFLSSRTRLFSFIPNSISFFITFFLRLLFSFLPFIPSVVGASSTRTCQFTGSPSPRIYMRVRIYIRAPSEKEFTKPSKKKRYAGTICDSWSYWHNCWSALIPFN